MSEMTNKAMRICENSGFQLDLPNGVTVSVQFGPGNYCDADVRSADFGSPKGKDVWGSDTAECAAYIGTGSNTSWVSVPGFTGDGGDDVVGWLGVQKVLDFINRASQLVDPKAHVPVIPFPRETKARKVTRFMDMHSGGGSKEKWDYIYIEAPESEAIVIFLNRFGHSPHRVTCTCCGTDYSIYEEDSLEEATEFYLDAGEKLSDYLERDEILFIRDEDIKPDERVGDVRKQGFVWVD